MNRLLLVAYEPALIFLPAMLWAARELWTLRRKSDAPHRRRPRGDGRD